MFNSRADGTSPNSATGSAAFVSVSRCPFVRSLVLLAVCMVWENWYDLVGIYILDARPHLQGFTCTDVMVSLEFCPIVGDNTSWVVGSWAALV
jgi:hypothetical protein